MKPLTVRINGRKYSIRPEGVAIIAVAALLVISLIIFAVVRLTHKKEEPEEVEEEVVEVEENYDVSAGVLDKKQYDGTVLEETEDAGIAYVNSTLFLGDSNTARFLREINPDTKKTFASKENAIGVVGMGIDAIPSFPCMDFSTGRVSMPQAVKILQPERVIITMGTNNLYGTSTESTNFIERYAKGIKAVQAAYPTVDIIVNSIPPVAKNTTYTNVSMTQIDAYNKAIAKMCKDNNWKYLNSAETMKDEKTGYARDGYMVSADGLHLSNKGLQALFKYIRTHAWITDDDRPKPLAAIPTIIGVPDGLIRTDPLTNSEFKVDPSTIESDATPEPTASATPTPTPTPTANPLATSCSNSGGSWNGTTCACPANSTWVTTSATTGSCACNAGYERLSGSTACTPIQTTPADTTTEDVTPTEDNTGSNTNTDNSSDSGQGTSGGESTQPSGDTQPQGEVTPSDTPTEPVQPEPQPVQPEQPEQQTNPE